MKLRLFAALLLFAIPSFAQVPGYLGKRFVLQVNAYPGVAVWGPTSSNRGIASFYDQHRTPGFNIMGDIEAGFVVSRIEMLSFSLGYMPPTGVTVEDITSPSAVEYETDYHTLFYQIGGFSQGINYYIFRNKWGGLAPMGFFYGLHVQNFLLSGKVADKKSEYAYTLPLAPNPIGIVPRTTYTSIGLSSGFNKIVANKFVLSWSAKVSIRALDRVILGIKNTPGEETYMMNNNVEFRSAVSSRMGLRTWLLFRISAGLLK